MTHVELRELLEAQALAAGAVRNSLLAKKRAAIFARLAATADNIPHGRLAELAELVQRAPDRFNRVLDEIGTTFTPRHAVEFAAGVVNRLRAQGSNSNLYAPKNYREIFSR